MRGAMFSGGGLGHRRHQWRAVPSQGVEVNSLVVRRTVDPASVYDPDPLGGQGADRGMVAVPLVDLLAVIGTGPLALWDRVAGPFVERLPEELRASPAHVDPLALAAGLRHRSDPAEVLDLAGIGESVAVGAESGNQAGHHHFSGTGQGVEYGVVGMRFRQGANALVQVGDPLVEHGDDLAHPMRQDDAGFEHGLVARRWDGFANLLQALVD